MENPVLGTSAVNKHSTGQTSACSYNPPFTYKSRFVLMQKLCRDHIGGQMMAGSMQVNKTFVKAACIWIRKALLMC